MRPAIKGLRGLMLDLDGTVYQDNCLIAGASEAIAALRERGYRLRFVTNTTNKRRETIRDRLHTLESRWSPRRSSRLPSPPA